MQPPGVVMITGATPGVPGGVLTVRTAAPADNTVAGAPPIVTTVPNAKPDPWIMKTAPPVDEPWPRIVLVTIGVGLSIELCD